MCIRDRGRDPTELETRATLTMFDTNQDGLISFNEYMQHIGGAGWKAYKSMLSRTGQLLLGSLAEDCEIHVEGDSGAGGKAKKKEKKVKKGTGDKKIKKEKDTKKQREKEDAARRKENEEMEQIIAARLATAKVAVAAEEERVAKLCNDIIKQPDTTDE
eukprot:TRINITY_DN18541_c0_g1_i1.p1 TRINITY_DN18541_c0_g1~~TRINITY_DN18541_c0_g1_i1.p1  ORF type:complete len:159 (+),score=51.98 TRINITY_DN18541_c0_g1_i1:156-632(+)